MRKDCTSLGELALKIIAGATSSELYRSIHMLDAYGYTKFVVDLKKHTLPDGEVLYEEVEGWNFKKTEVYVYLRERPVTRRLS